MSAERYLNFVSKTTDTSGYGAACKASVEALLEYSDIFTLAQVETDTTSVYKAWLQVYDSNLYLCIFNSSSYVCCYLHYGLNGPVLHKHEFRSNFYRNDAGLSYGAMISRIGDFVFTVGLHSSFYNNAVRLRFAKGVSEYNGETYWFVNFGAHGSAGFGGYTACLSMLDEYSSVTGVNASTGVVKTNYSFQYGEKTTSITTPTGAKGVLNPHNYLCTTSDTTEYLGHIKWGGKYDMYRLYSPAGIYSVSPDGEYTIDGVTYKGVFNYLYIPVECS